MPEIPVELEEPVEEHLPEPEEMESVPEEADMQVVYVGNSRITVTATPADIIPIQAIPHLVEAVTPIRGRSLYIVVMQKSMSRDHVPGGGMMYMTDVSDAMERIPMPFTMETGVPAVDRTVMRKVIM